MDVDEPQPVVVPTRTLRELETLCGINQCLAGGKSSKYTEKNLTNLGDFFMLLPEDLAFSVLKDLALNNDMNERLLLKRDDLFAILKHARKGDIG